MEADVLHLAARVRSFVLSSELSETHRRISVLRKGRGRCFFPGVLGYDVGEDYLPVDGSVLGASDLRSRKLSSSNRR